MPSPKSKIGKPWHCKAFRKEETRFSKKLFEKRVSFSPLRNAVAVAGIVVALHNEIASASPAFPEPHLMLQQLGKFQLQNIRHRSFVMFL